MVEKSDTSSTAQKTSAPSSPPPAAAQKPKEPDSDVKKATAKVQEAGYGNGSLTRSDDNTHWRGQFVKNGRTWMVMVNDAGEVSANAI